MSSRKTIKLLGILLALCLLAAPLASAEYRLPAVSDDPQAQEQPGLPDASPRLIVELKSAPLAVWYTTQSAVQASGGKLDVNAEASQAYIAKLQSEQNAFVTSLRTTLPEAKVASYTNGEGASVKLDYQITFNGMAVDIGSMDQTAARKLLARKDGVKAVYLDLAQHTDLYT